MVKPIRVLYVGSGILQSITDLFRDHPNFILVGDASNQKDALLQYGLLRPDIVLLDFMQCAPGIIEIILSIRLRYERAKVLVLSQIDDIDSVRAILNAGASGYLLRQFDTSDLALSVRAVNSGTIVLSPMLIHKLIRPQMSA